VALSVGSRPPGVTWHPALRSPDFPPPRHIAGATARPTPKSESLLLSGSDRIVLNRKGAQHGEKGEKGEYSIHTGITKQDEN